MSEEKFLKNYFKDLKELLNIDLYLNDLLKTKKILGEINLDKKKNNDFWQRR